MNLEPNKSFSKCQVDDENLLSVELSQFDPSKSNSSFKRSGEEQNEVRKTPKNFQLGVAMMFVSVIGYTVMGF